jgi:uncharacterized membrane protein YccC
MDRTVATVMVEIYQLRRLTGGDVYYAISMGLASLISYWIATKILAGFVGSVDDQLGGMWAAIAAAFVSRHTSAGTRSAGVVRFMATLVSFILCTVYFLFASPSALGMAIVVVAGALVLQLVNLEGDVLTMTITTIVVMVVAILNPAHAVGQPLLRLIDTIVGIATGIACYWAATPLRARVPVNTDAEHTGP